MPRKIEGRVGTSRNKWKLVPECCDRPLLQDHAHFRNLQHYSNKVNGFALHKRVRSVQKHFGLDCFLCNVFANRELSNTEILLAALLYRELEISQNTSGFIYSIGDKSHKESLLKVEQYYRELEQQDVAIKLDSGNYEDPHFYPEFLICEIQNLLTLFTSTSGVSIEPKKLKDALTTLHNVGYITASQMSSNNDRVSNAISARSRSNIRSTLVHIRMCSWMVDRNLSKGFENKAMNDGSKRKRTNKFRNALSLLISTFPTIYQTEIKALDSYKSLMQKAIGLGTVNNQK